MTSRHLLSVFTLITLPCWVAAADADAGIAFFEAKIRPVLIEQCYQCHGADKQRGGLRLDSRDAVLKGGDTGPALVPGKPNESLIVKAIRQQELKMPPKGKLTDAVVADFAKWIELGAPDPRDGKASTIAAINFTKARQFWSFQPPREAPLPKVQDAAWPKTAIDHYILARLEAEKLQPVAPAGKRELIRRATFDLIGLPPTPEEVEVFVKDEAPDAFAKVVERLLASPHYGERWGRHWLDVARYAEDQAHTFGVRPSTNAYRYRDWVIAALNDDMPYDRFVKLQLAADLLLTDDAERVKHLPSLGFIGLGAQYYKDNSEILKALADELDERVDTVSRGLLGLTVACARCHDHKFDPIPTQDYYSIAGIFNSCKLGDVPLASRDEVEKYQEGVKLARAAEDKLKTFVRTEKTACQTDQAGEIARYMQAARKVQERRQKEPKWSTRDQAKADGLHAATLDRWMKYLDGAPKVPALDAWRNLPKPTEPDKGDEIVAAAQAFQQHVQALLVERAKGGLDKDKTTLLDALFGDKGLFNLSDDELKARLPADKKQQMEQMQQELTKLRKEAPDKMEAKFAIAHGVGEGTAADMKVYIRGNPRTQGDVAPRRFLRILAADVPPTFTQGSGRLELANAIASKDNPLTARVIVNRVWAWHFGRGIVGTPSNFGSLGERPTHPELLDYLTCRFMASGWSLKRLHRDIMLSATYQLSSADHETNRNIDGDNRFLWRMNRHRLDIEAWRDALLAVSGKLDRTFGGPTNDLGSAANARRTVYGKISRHDLNGLLRLFDFPDANITSEKRTETTVPQQQLFVLNSAFVVDQAKALAARVQKEGADDGERVRRVYALAYGRPATDAEVELIVRFLSAEDPAEEKAKVKLTRWERVTQALLGSNEFMYID
jgi:cytochrome c553